MRAMHLDLTEIPETITGGTSVTWRKTYGEFPADGGWTAKLYLAGASVFNKAATASGSDFVYALTNADTTALLPGVYSFWERVTQGGQSYDACTGRLTILADPATATAGSLQSYAEKTLAALLAFQAGNLTSGIRNYVIGDRSLEYYSPDEISKLIGVYRAQVEATKHPGKIAREVRVEFTGP